MSQIRRLGQFEKTCHFEKKTGSQLIKSSQVNENRLRLNLVEKLAENLFSDTNK